MHSIRLGCMEGRHTLQEAVWLLQKWRNVHIESLMNDISISILSMQLNCKLQKTSSIAYLNCKLQLASIANRESQRPAGFHNLNRETPSLRLFAFATFPNVRAERRVCHFSSSSMRILARGMDSGGGRRPLQIASVAMRFRSRGLRRGLNKE